jgi:hypothetical protein
LADRQQPEDRSIAANAAKSIPIEPLARIQQAEKYEYENAANDYRDIATSKESPHFRIRLIARQCFRMTAEMILP